MRDLAEQIDQLSIEYEEKIVENISALISSVIAILNDNSVKQTITLSDGSTISKDVVDRRKLRTILNELRKLELKASNMIYDGVLLPLELAIALTVDNLSKNYDSVVKKARITPKTFIDQQGADGLTLKDRTEFRAMSYTDDLHKRIRQSINKGYTVSETINEVHDVFNGKEWELRRLVTTETFNAYRKQVGKIAEENELTWIKIHESFPRHPRRRFHECYKYAHEDKYGKGQGVFKTHDAKIYFPHPQCTSWLELIELTGEV